MGGAISAKFLTLITILTKIVIEKIVMHICQKSFSSKNGYHLITGFYRQRLEDPISLKLLSFSKFEAA